MESLEPRGELKFEPRGSSLPRSYFYAQTPGRPSRSSSDIGFDLEYVSRPFHSGVRDSEIRRRPGTAEPIRTNRGGALSKEGSRRDGGLSLAADQALVPAR